MTLPLSLTPMLAQFGEPFDSDDYLFEIKWDGVRTLLFVDEGGYRLVNRRHVDMTARYPEFDFLVKLPAGTLLDGEMVVLKDGKVVEHGPARQIFEAPQQAYTKALMAAAFELEAVETGAVRQ